MNYFGDYPEYPPPSPPDNTVKIVLIVLASVFGGSFLVCAGFALLMYFAMLSAQEQVERELAANSDWPTYAVEPDEYSQAVQQGDYQAALDSLDRQLKQFPDNAWLHNNKAWLLSTCPVAEIRDGEKAVEHAGRACGLTNYVNYMMLDTLAAAHAEQGDFDEAVRWQKKAIEMMPADTFDGGGVRDRLELFESGQPYREGIVPPGYQEPADVTMSDDSSI